MRPRILLLLVLLVSLPGCLVSEQVGERTHVNSSFPEEVAFHFESTFNRVLWLGRSGALLLIPLWVFRMRKGGPNTIPIILGIAAGVLSVYLLIGGWIKIDSYRIDVLTDGLHMTIPGEPALRTSWEQIEELEVEGMALNVDMVGDGPRWAPQWEDLRIRLVGGATHNVDLTPLSVEQRGTFWRAIVRKADLEEMNRTLPAKKPRPRG